MCKSLFTHIFVSASRCVRLCLCELSLQLFVTMHIRTESQADTHALKHTNTERVTHKKHKKIRTKNTHKTQTAKLHTKNTQHIKCSQKNLKTNIKHIQDE